MLERQQGNTVVIHADERKIQAMPENPMTYETLSPEGTESLAMYRVTAAPGQTTGPYLLQHAGDENFLVLTGWFEFEVEGQRYTVGPGDSAFIPRGLRHRFTNVGPDTGEAVFVHSPPAY